MGVISIIVFSLILVLDGCSAAKVPTGPPKPELSELEFNWGRIPQNSIVTHVYNLSNAGGDSIIIEELRPHCGCTKAPLSTNVVHAGESIPIELRFNSKGYRNKARKSASLRLKSGEEVINNRLVFNAYVDTSSILFSDGQIEVSMPIVEFTDSIESIEIGLKNRMAASRNLIIVDYQSDRIEVSWEEKKLKPKDSVRLKITRKIPSKELFASITMEMEGYDNSRITIPVSGINRRATRLPSVKKVSRSQKSSSNIPWLDDPNYRGRPR
ncbi:DUF1573 domain-containing protein [bacterium]|nr:DUF1573 domain-containing protein [bacterium]